VAPGEAERLSDSEFSERVRLYASLIVTDDYESAQRAGLPHLHHVSLVREVAVRTAVSDWLSRLGATST